MLQNSILTGDELEELVRTLKGQKRKGRFLVIGLPSRKDLELKNNEEKALSDLIKYFLEHKNSLSLSVLVLLMMKLTHQKMFIKK